MPIALKALRENQLIQEQEGIEVTLELLVKQKWHLRVLIVFDIFNDDYDAGLGHLPERNNLPVFSVHISDKGASARVADEGMRQRVNRETCKPTISTAIIAFLHTWWIIPLQYHCI